MPPIFSLNVVAPEKTIYSGKARSVIAPGVDGYFGVLAHHAPMVAQLAAGALKITDDAGADNLYALSGGFLEVVLDGGSQVTILADAAEPAENIDVARAKAAEQRARERLASHNADIDQARAQGALERALNRLKVAQGRP